MNNVNSSPMLNAYPDSIGGSLSGMVDFLRRPQLKEVFGAFYILPSLFNTDLDRGFSIIDYGINEVLAGKAAVKELALLGLELKLDFVLNHISVLSPQFQDLLKQGDASPYKDFFINWNEFFAGAGQMTAEGYIQPEQKFIKDMFTRKPGLPFLMVRFPDGKEMPYWNTFYQEAVYPEISCSTLMDLFPIQYLRASMLAAAINEQLKSGKKAQQLELGEFAEHREKIGAYLEAHRRYLGQMDLNIQCPKVWEYYEQTLATLASYGAKIVRLDAFAYASKKAGRRNFLNEPETWELLRRLQSIADRHGMELLPEIHASYAEKTYRVLAKKGYLVYDFFLPGLILDAIEHGDGQYLLAWAQEMDQAGIHTVNMLGCHDGIPLLDLRGLLPEERIQQLIRTIVARGGYVKDLHGQKDVYYQVNSTYFSALGEDEQKLLCARAIQLFMPGKPQIWYLDLLAGVNDLEAMKKAGPGGHKEINRTNFTQKETSARLRKLVVGKQLALIRFRNTCAAFGFDAAFRCSLQGTVLSLEWQNNGARARLEADLFDCSYKILSETG